MQICNGCVCAFMPNACQHLITSFGAKDVNANTSWIGYHFWHISANFWIYQGHLECKLEHYTCLSFQKISSTVNICNLQDREWNFTNGYSCLLTIHVPTNPRPYLLHPATKRRILNWMELNMKYKILMDALLKMFSRVFWNEGFHGSFSCSSTWWRHEKRQNRFYFNWADKYQ